MRMRKWFILYGEAFPHNLVLLHSHKQWNSNPCAYLEVVVLPGLNNCSSFPYSFTLCSWGNKLAQWLSSQIILLKMLFYLSSICDRFKISGYMEFKWSNPPMLHWTAWISRFLSIFIWKQVVLYIFCLILIFEWKFEWKCVVVLLNGAAQLSEEKCCICKWENNRKCINIFAACFISEGGGRGTNHAGTCRWNESQNQTPGIMMTQ